MKEISKSGSSSDLIFGTRPVLEALEAGKPIDRVFLVKGSSSEVHREIALKCHKARIPLRLSPIEKLNQLTRKTHQGVVAFLSPVEFDKLEWLLPAVYEAGKTPLFVMLDGVTDVRNFGAIARSAECMGADGLIIPDRGTAAINGEALKASAGALVNIPICRYKNLMVAATFLKESGVDLVACTEKSKITYDQIPLTGPVCLVMGAEDIGIQQEILSECNYQAQIPMQGKTASLNVSVSAGILLSEVSRQRRVVIGDR